MNSKRPPNKAGVFRELVGLLLVIVFSPLILVLVGSYLLYAFILHITVWLLWCTRGKFVLFVYSDSPIWRDYIHDHILPEIRDYSVVLNWSERRKWRQWLSLPVMAFRVFGGNRNFNPMAVVFRPFRLSKIFRFWRPFQDFKHGKREPLDKMEREFFALLDLVTKKTA